MEQEATTNPWELLPAVDRHLHGFKDVFFWVPAGLAARAYALAGETALLAGFLAFKLNMRPQADVYWSHAERFAEASGHLTLQAALLALQSWRWGGQGSAGWDDENPMRAIALLDRAVAVLGPHPDPRAAALVRSWRASTWVNTGAPAKGEAARTVLVDLETTETHLSRVDHGDGAMYVIESIRGEATHTRADCLSWLGRSEEAMVEYERMLGWLRDPSPSWRSAIMTSLGTAHARLGDPEQASGLLGTALELAREAASPYRERMVRVAYQRQLAHSDSPAVKALGDQLR
jgi:tetratricopeptide (TPR) repeat protein